MAVIHISEAEALRDFSALLDHVCAGSEVVIEGQSATVAVLVPPREQTIISEPERYVWFAHRYRGQSTIPDLAFLAMT